MDRTESATPDSVKPNATEHEATKAHLSSTPSEEPPSLEGGPHDFDAQKRIHQQIRNDPDYDDWEYGTEPLPHEAWIAGRSATTTTTTPTPETTPQG